MGPAETFEKRLRIAPGEMAYFLFETNALVDSSKFIDKDSFMKSSRHTAFRHAVLDKRLLVKAVAFMFMIFVPCVKQ